MFKRILGVIVAISVFTLFSLGDIALSAPSSRAIRAKAETQTIIVNKPVESKITVIADTVVKSAPIVKGNTIVTVDPISKATPVFKQLILCEISDGMLARPIVKASSTVKAKPISKATPVFKQLILCEISDGMLARPIVKASSTVKAKPIVKSTKIAAKKIIKAPVHIKKASVKVTVKKAPIKRKTKTTLVSRSAVKRPTPIVVKKKNISQNGTASNIIAYAKLFIGTPYRYGGTSPSGFDCSGFTSYVFARFGISLPRVSRSQAGVGTAVSRSQLQPGDLVLFGSPVHHVGIYVGNGRYIHSPKTGDHVRIATLDRFTIARRVIR